MAHTHIAVVARVEQRRSRLLRAAAVRRRRRLPHVVVAAGKRLETPLVRGLVHKVSNKLGPLDYGSFMPLMF